MIGINASAPQIDEFISNADSFKSACDALTNVNANFDATYYITKDAIKTLNMIADSNFSKVQSDIGYAHHIMKNNKAALEDINNAAKKLENSGVDKSSPEYKKTKERINQSYANVKKTIDALEKLIANLNRKMEAIQKAMSYLNKTEGEIDTLYNHIKAHIYEMCDYLTSIISDSNMAKAFLIKIGENLAEVGENSFEYGQIVAVKSPKFLYAMSNSLSDLYQDVNDNGDGLIRSLNNFTNIFRDQVSTKSADQLSDMVYLFSDKIKDFNDYSLAFKEAGDYLVKYESLKK